MEEWERLLDELRSEFLLREEELELLHQIDLRILEGRRPLEETFSFIVTESQNLIKSDHVHVLFRRGRYLETVYSSSETDIGQLVPVSTSLTGQCLTESQSVNVPDLAIAPYAQRYVIIENYDGPEMRSLLAAPIILHDSTIGVLNAESRKEGAFRPVHERILNSIAAQVAIAIQRSQVFDQATLFSDVDQLIFDDTVPDHVLQSALEKVMHALHRIEYVELTGAQILFPSGPDELEIVYSTSPSDVGLKVAIDQSICGRAVRERRTIVVGDVSKDREYLRMLGSAIQSEIAVPILIGDDKVVIGVLNVESTELDVFGGYYQLILESFADKVKTLLAFSRLRSQVTEALELRHANDLLIAVGDQTSNMIHRLNNTVGAMRYRLRELQAMQDDGHLEDNSELREALQSLLDLANQTLEMPQQVTRFLNQDQDILSLNESVEWAVREISIPSNVALDLSLDPDVPALQLYCFDLVVQNLLQNALDAMPDGGRLSIATSITSHLDFMTGYVQLTVRDTGVGVPEHIRPRLFDLNFTTKGSKGKGLGLGLWWVRNFIRRAKGDIAISSTVGRGSEVVVKMPVGSSGLTSSLTTELSSS